MKTFSRDLFGLFRVVRFATNTKVNFHGKTQSLSSLLEDCNLTHPASMLFLLNYNKFIKIWWKKKLEVGGPLSMFWGRRLTAVNIFAQKHVFSFEIKNFQVHF